MRLSRKALGDLVETINFRVDATTLSLYRINDASISSTIAAI